MARSFFDERRAAVRFARSGGVDLWIIGIRLPDMSGFELFEMLREQLVGTPVFIVADQYDPEEERRVCGCGATLYMCKSTTGVLQGEALLELLVGQRQGAAASADAPQGRGTPARFLKSQRMSARRRREEHERGCGTFFEKAVSGIRN